MKKSLAIASLALVSAMASMPAFAADEFNTAPGLTAAGAPLGLSPFSTLATASKAGPSLQRCMTASPTISRPKPI